MGNRPKKPHSRGSKENTCKTIYLNIFATVTYTIQLFAIKMQKNMPQNKISFPTSMDKMAKGTTTAVTLLFIAIITSEFALTNGPFQGMPKYTSIGLLLIYLLVYGLRPVRYTVTPEHLVIHRPLKDVKIERSMIESVTVIDKSDIAWTMRIFGSGGLFGYFGRFRNKKIGIMTWYATRKDSAIWVRTINNKNIILTPDKPNQFVSAINC